MAKTKSEKSILGKGAPRNAKSVAGSALSQRRVTKIGGIEISLAKPRKEPEGATAAEIRDAVRFVYGPKKRGA